MERIAAFISYSSEEKQFAGKFKNYLQLYCGFKVFLAHDDIMPSNEWEKEILNAIKKTDFFIPLISHKFKSSPYTDQEVGMAIALKKKIIPIKLGRLNPYGFVNKYHALQYRDNDILQLATMVAIISTKYDKNYSNKALNSIVYALRNSASFETSNVIINKIITDCPQLNNEQLKMVIEGISHNSQIQGAFGLPQLKQILLEKYKISLDQKK